jgi:hypothetical protein
VDNKKERTKGVFGKRPGRRCKEGEKERHEKKGGKTTSCRKLG